MNETTLIVDAQREPPQSHGALADLRAGAMSLPVERMKEALAEYKERRQTFREWLLAQLIEGVHFGWSPGTEPVYNEDRTCVQQGQKWIPLSQWTPKKSFYKAGADFVCDLMLLLDKYKADFVGWQQAGSPPGVFVYACRLYSKENGAMVGEGRGARKVSTDARIKTDAYNSGVKMAKKSAKIDAVLNAYGLSDLFTQDEGGGPRDHINPDADETQPHVATREQRPTPDQAKAQADATKMEVMRLVKAWKDFAHGTPEEMEKYFHTVTGRQFNIRQTGEWTAADLQAVADAIAKEVGA